MNPAEISQDSITPSLHHSVPVTVDVRNPKEKMASFTVSTRLGIELGLFHPDYHLVPIEVLDLARPSGEMREPAVSEGCLSWE